MILDQAPVIFGTVKEGIMESFDEWLSTHRAEVAYMVGVRSLNLWEFCACGAPKFFGELDQLSVGDGLPISRVPR